MANTASAIELFRGGFDPESISRLLQITEAQALEQISIQRSAMLGLPNPYRDLQPGRAFDRFQSQSFASGGVTQN